MDLLKYIFSIRPVSVVRILEISLSLLYGTEHHQILVPVNSMGWTIKGLFGIGGRLGSVQMTSTRSRSAFVIVDLILQLQ